MDLPQLDPIVARPEDEPTFQREIWQPTWNCFCCQDTGVIRPHLIRLVMKDYNWNIHKIPACRNPKCNASSKLGEAITHMLDCRVTATICHQLDQLSRDDWKQTTQLKHETLQQLANTKSLRQRARSPEEDEIAKERKRIAEEE